MSDKPIDKLHELMQKQEDLDPRLKPWTTMDGPFGMSIKHPLVFSVMHSPQMNAMVNNALRKKLEMVDEAWNENKWGTYVFLHERPHRLDAFYEAAEFMDDETYWKLLGDIWIDSENIWQNEALWVEVLHSDRDERTSIMDEDDLKVHAELPADVEVYRGCNRDERIEGLSWTTDKEIARWFARRLYLEGECDEPSVAVGRVARKNVIACFNGRNEKEVVALPEHVELDRIEVVGARTEMGRHRWHGPPPDIGIEVPMPTENPRPERPADLGKKARNDLLYLARAERSMGNDLLASRIEGAVESLDAFRSFAIHQAEQIADLKERLDRKMARLRQADEVIAGLEAERASVECPVCEEQRGTGQGEA